MKVVGFLNNKGGVGKTGSITTLAHMIATEYKRKVLVVDIDHRRIQVSFLVLVGMNRNIR